MGRLSNLAKYRIANALGQASFWGGVFLLYFQEKGVSNSQMISLIGVMSLVAVVAEYPTGVIGDRFSHKFSMALGNLIVGLSLLGMALSPNILIFSISVVIMGIGLAFRSGSNEALLSSLSTDLNNDVGKFRGEGLLSALAATAAGSLLVGVHLYLPIYLSVVSFIFAALIQLSIDAPPSRNSKGDVFKTAKEGIRYALKSPQVLYSVLLSVPFAIMINNQKWFSNPLFEELDISVIHWGWLIVVMILVRVLGNRISGKLKNNQFIYLLFLFATLGFGFSQFGLIVIAALFLLAPLSEILNNKIDVRLMEVIPEEIKASVLSFKALVHRLMTGLFMLVASGIIKDYSLAYVSVFSFILFALIALFTFNRSVLANE